MGKNITFLSFIFFIFILIGVFSSEKKTEVEKNTYKKLEKRKIKKKNRANTGGPESSSSGYFIKPVKGWLSQGKHNRYAVDLACKVGTPVKASASGEVVFAKSGWNGAFGKLVKIKHPNGTKTYYAHLSKINVSLGEWVKQGEIIGKSGNTGRSTGPHLHFEVRGAKNPGFNNSWAK